MSLMFVKIHFGPCFDHHTYSHSHRPQKLTGIRDSLLKLGYRVSLIPVQYLNKCVFEICGYNVFCCNIRNLKFNTALEHDEVAQKALEAVIDATERFSRTRCYLWTWMFIDDQTFKRNQFVAKDYWYNKNDIKPMNEECRECCRILTSERPHEEYHFTEEMKGSDKVLFPFDEPLEIKAQPKSGLNQWKGSRQKDST